MWNVDKKTNKCGTNKKKIVYKGFVFFFCFRSKNKICEIVLKNVVINKSLIGSHGKMNFK